jgi:hypothetical protein
MNGNHDINDDEKRYNRDNEQDEGVYKRKCMITNNYLSIIFSFTDHDENRKNLYNNNSIHNADK